MNEPTTTAALPDVQSGVPETRLGLSRVGITGVEKIIRVRANGDEQLFFAELESAVDLGPEQAGVHMSRFEEVVNEAIDEVVLGEALRAEGLAAHIAERVRERQGGLRAEVRIAARYPETVPAPVSGTPTQEIYTLFGTAVASARGTRTLTGVEAQGMTACPCAQGLVAEAARARLAQHGYEPEQIDEILEAVPVATHNQRGIGRLYVGRTEDGGAEIDARTLLRIVEGSMSSEIYELMKRSDEQHVVEKAHRQPRFVEDVVREMLRRVVAELGGLGDGAFVMARQKNLETIHRHDVVAERYGLLSEISAELTGGESSAHHMTMREWLEAPCAAAGSSA
ncbi:MAG: GTP cyclohydrolase MptA [Solirubrobacterales bacterium]